ncbi:9599_t:CDS:2 [Ambispora leptoticha]|uniref:9599_t:CDS:1 n=1 Tax=Ambispora leptoticha TaxID=144679 RepID=A0A9N9B830_9GLOM|nr:9599_t:CDS:2 [Ambispora leptoticha]
MDTTNSKKDDIIQQDLADHQQPTQQQLPPHQFTLTLIDILESLVQAWKKELAAINLKSNSLNVEIHLTTFQNYLETRSAECIVSPANSFGLMDGGLDYYISEYYGGVNSLIPVVQSAIQEDWCGEQNVGTCLLVDVDELAQKVKGSVKDRKNVPRYIAHCPTMRTPKALYGGDDIVYRCTWALLTSIRKHNATLRRPEDRINNVICAGFGTGVGEFPEEGCVKQMILAIKHFLEAPVNVGRNKSNDKNLGWGSEWHVMWPYARHIESGVQHTLLKEEHNRENDEDID